MKKNGEYAYFRGTGEIIRDEAGNPLRVAGTIMDTTETKNILLDTERQRVEAEAANKAKSAFLSTMSHEIRTPMNAILGITEIQLQNHALDESVREAFDKIYVSGDMLLGIINDILDLSKIEAGKLELAPAIYETASMICDTAQLNMMRIGSKHIEFELYVDENLPVYLLGDELRVKQILNNILSNAIKYTDSGTVKLSVSRETDSNNNDDTITMVFSVSDTGQGMTVEQINKLFDEYSRFNVEANRTTEGTGLGMSITRNLIRMMNGTINIESEPGKGTSFTVHLPQGRGGPEILGSEMVENLHKFRTSSRSQMKRVQIVREHMPYGSVLIVDDVETNIYVARGLMVPYGLKIDSADSGYAAIEKIRNGNVYDIVFMDHMMPKMDGIEATKIIRELGYKNPVVALTANAVSGQADIFFKNSFDDYISKPIDVRQLNSVLNKLIRDKQPQETLEATRRQAKAGAKNEQPAADAPQPAIDPHFAGIFVRDARKSITVLEAINEKQGSYNDEDIRNYVINVHGMKSALANIGKTELSAVAFKLEKSGRSGNTEVMASETPAFLSSLKKMIEELTPKEETDAGEASDEDQSYFREKLLAIRAACEEYDEKTADDIIAELRKKAWPHTARELLSAISEHLLHSDFDEVVNVVNTYTQRVS
jgi:signal transduction histidine kinase/DNA-binding response OmpR family regulator